MNPKSNGARPGASSVGGGVKPGDKVAALWSDGGYYLGRVTAVNGGNCAVLYDDGDQGVVAAGEVIRTAAATETIGIGTRVLAAWRGAQMFTGVVTVETEYLVTVRWDDGDAPLAVAKDRVAVLSGPGPAVALAAAGRLVPGMRVAAMWCDGSYWGAAIKGVQGDRFEVVYDDGDQDLRSAAELIPITDEDIAPGTPVLACWRNGARMYPGVVTAKNGNRYTVKWDDGDTPTEEARDKIVVLRAR